MIQFESGKPLLSSDLNSNFSEAAAGGFMSGSGQAGQFSGRGFIPSRSPEKLPAGWIVVQNNYPFRLEKLTPVGIDFPIIEHDVTDGDSLLRFVDEETIYSCMAAQARHGNRIAILQQPLETGDIGFAVLEGLTKAVVHEAFPVSPGEYTASGALVQSSEQSVDIYRSLGVPGAEWVSGRGTEYYVNNVFDTWGPRHRSKTLWAMTSRRADGSAMITDQLPYDELGSTPNGRISAQRLMRIPEITPTGSSTATCQGGAWKITASTCSEGSSSHFAIEFAPYPIGTGPQDYLIYPCVENDTVASIPCYANIPSDDEYDVRTAPWSGENSILDDNVNELIGIVSLGNSSVSPHAASALESVWSNTDDSENQNLARGEFDSCDLQYAFDTGDDMDSTVRRCCANLTCTYQHEDDGSWTLYRGVEPYRLGYFDNGVSVTTVKCICPTELVTDRSTKEFANEALKEITLGMIYSTTSTTSTSSSSTTSSTTTTTTLGACCQFDAAGIFIDCFIGTNVVGYPDTCLDGTTGRTFTEGETCENTTCFTSCCNCAGSECIEIEAGTECFIHSDGSSTFYNSDAQNGVHCVDRDCMEIVGACCQPRGGPYCFNTCETECVDYPGGGGSAVWLGGGTECDVEGFGTTICDSTTTTSTSTSTSTSTTSTSTTTSDTSTTSTTTTTSDPGSSSSTTSSTTTSSEGSSSSTTSSTTTTSTAACNQAPNECTYQCQNVGGYQWVNTSGTCSTPCACDTVPNEGSICGTCDAGHENNTCSDPSFCN